MKQEFETLKEMCDFALQQSKNSEKIYEIGNDENGEICLYEKVLIGKVVENGKK